MPNLNIRISKNLDDKIKEYCVLNNTTKTKLVIDYFEGLLENNCNDNRNDIAENTTSQGLYDLVMSLQDRIVKLEYSHNFTNQTDELKTVLTDINYRLLLVEDQVFIRDYFPTDDDDQPAGDDQPAIATDQVPQIGDDQPPAITPDEVPPDDDQPAPADQVPQIKDDQPPAITPDQVPLKLELEETQLLLLPEMTDFPTKETPLVESQKYDDQSLETPPSKEGEVFSDVKPALKKDSFNSVDFVPNLFDNEEKYPTIEIIDGNDRENSMNDNFALKFEILSREKILKKEIVPGWKCDYFLLLVDPKNPQKNKYAVTEDFIINIIENVSSGKSFDDFNFDFFHKNNRVLSRKMQGENKYKFDNFPDRDRHKKYQEIWDFVAQRLGKS